MNTNEYVIDIDGLSVKVIRKAIKNLHLAVYPPNGSVRIAVPIIVKDESIRLAVVSKLAWIKRQQRAFQQQPRQNTRQIVTGESHYYLGKRYLLDVEHSLAPPKLEFKNNKILRLFANDDITVKEKQLFLHHWYKVQMKKIVPELIAKWERKTGLTVLHCGIRKMKTKWGSCNPVSKRIWLNLELIKKPMNCIEYIIVHEMVHFLERKHNDHFIAYMDKFIPQWRTFKDELNQAPLAYEHWKY